MYFYQAYGPGFECKVRQTPEEAFKDLKDRGYEIVALRSHNNEFPLYDPSRNIGIALIRV